VVHAGEFVGHARIVDLAVGGVRVQMAPTVMPAIGARVRIDLRLDGVGRWHHVSGHIERSAACELVIAFDEVPAGFEDAVHDELLAALECARTRQVVLVDADCRRRERIAHAFLAAGMHAIQTSSPLEAIAELDESRLHPWAIVIANSRGAHQLRAFLGNLYPRIPMMTIGAT
jgi:arginine decarboxylase-like protein